MNRIRAKFAAKCLLWVCGLGAALLLAILVWFSWPNSGTLIRDAVRSDINGMKRSLSFRADINGYSKWGWHRENKGDTPLTAAVQHGNLETVKFLLVRGADPDQRDGSGMPPICWAAILGRMDVSKELVDAGARVTLPDIDCDGRPEKSAVDYAEAEGHIELARYLRTKSEQDGRGDGEKPPN